MGREGRLEGGWVGMEKERRGGELDSLGAAGSLQWTGAKKGTRGKRKKGRYLRLRPAQTHMKGKSKLLTV